MDFSAFRRKINNGIRKISPVTIGIGLIAIVLLQGRAELGINNSESVSLKTIENTTENTQTIINSEFSILDSDLRSAVRSAVRPRWEVELESQMMPPLKATLPDTITPTEMLDIVREAEAVLAVENEITRMISETEESVRELNYLVSLEDAKGLFASILSYSEAVPADPQSDDNRHTLEESTRIIVINFRIKLWLLAVQVAVKSPTIFQIIQAPPVLYLYSALLIIILLYHSIRQGYCRSRAGARNLKFKIKNYKLVNVFHKLKFICNDIEFLKFDSDRRAVFSSIFNFKFSIFNSDRRSARAGARNLKLRIKNYKLVNVFHKLKFVCNDLQFKILKLNPASAESSYRIAHHKLSFTSIVNSLRAGAYFSLIYCNIHQDENIFNTSQQYCPSIFNFQFSIFNSDRRSAGWPESCERGIANVKL